MDVDVPIVAALYGILIVTFGSFIVMNLILAVIIDAFTTLQNEEKNYAENELILTVSDDDIVSE